MNGNRILLDTNIVLYLLAGDLTLADFLQDKQVYLSEITELELIGYPSISTSEMEQIHDFLNSCESIPLNNEIKIIYSRIRKSYKLKLGDAAIIATALFLDIPLITADKHFAQVEELQLTLYNK